MQRLVLMVFVHFQFQFNFNSSKLISKLTLKVPTTCQKNHFHSTSSQKIHLLFLEGIKFEFGLSNHSWKCHFTAIHLPFPPHRGVFSSFSKFIPFTSKSPPMPPTYRFFISRALLQCWPNHYSHFYICGTQENYFEQFLWMFHILQLYFPPPENLTDFSHESWLWQFQACFELLKLYDFSLNVNHLNARLAIWEYSESFFIILKLLNWKFLTKFIKRKNF